jgi:hypothetical protein
VTAPGRGAARPRRRDLLWAAGLFLPACVGAIAPRAAAARANAATAAGNATTGQAGAPVRAPEMMGLALGMPIEAAIRVVQSMAPAGYVTLPPLRRDPVSIVRIEVPSALAAPAAEVPKDSNFYMMLNSAPRILKTQSSRSSHVPFVTLVAGDRDRRLLRIVFEPAFVHWPEGYDAGRRTAWSLVELLRERHGVDVELVPGESGRRAPPGPAGTDQPATRQPGWVLRVNAARRSIVLSDVRQLPDAFASRLQLD